MATIKTLLGYVKGPKGDTGEQGIQGVSGNDGAAATIEVGSVTTAAAGTPARVENVGTSSAAILNFTIPQGQPGSVGDISRMPVNEITSASGDYPVPAVGDTIATVAGKQAKATQDAQAGIAAANNSIENILGDFAKVEDTAYATKTYAVGEYLVLNGLFYKVTAAITAGNALVVGGNIEKTDVGTEITSLNTDFATKTTSPASGVTAVRFGTQVSVTIDKAISLSAGTWHNIASGLANDFCPKNQVFGLFVPNDGFSGICGVAIHTNGLIQVYSPSVSISRIIGQVIYYV